MAESAEHQFLSRCVTDVLGRMSKSRLYAYVEAERRKFDFACELRRDWSRPLVGQTLWSHTAGVDKDLRTMLLDSDAEICAYVARDTIKARRLLSEGMRDFRSSGAPVRPHRLRVFWVPNDFDADDEAQRKFVSGMLEENVSRDILMNIVFGNLGPEDIRFFVRASGVAGLNIAVLHLLSTTREKYKSTKDISAALGVSASAVRERLLRLLGSGFASQFGGGALLVQVTTKGRVFLDFCGELQKQVVEGVFTDEMRHIMRLLELRYAPSAVRRSAGSMHLAGPFLTEVPEMVTGRLLVTISAAFERWGILFDDIDHVIWESDEMRGSAVEAEVNQLRLESEKY